MKTKHQIHLLPLLGEHLRVARYCPIGIVSASDLSKATPLSVDQILGYAWPCRTVEIEGEYFIFAEAAADIIRYHTYYNWAAAGLEKWFKKNLTGNEALIAAGMSTSARLVHRIFGITESFQDWGRQIRRDYPEETFGIPFETLETEGDFPLPLGKVQMLAEESGAYLGNVMAWIVSECGFYHRSVLSREFCDVVEEFKPVIPSMNNGWVDARQACGILGEVTSFDLWLNFLTEDFPMVWGIDYLSELPIPEWDIDHSAPPPRMKGEVLFSASLIEQIAREPVYHEHRDFMEYAASIHAARRQSFGEQSPSPGNALHSDSDSDL